MTASNIKGPNKDYKVRKQKGAKMELDQGREWIRLLKYFKRYVKRS